MKTIRRQISFLSFFFFLALAIHGQDTLVSYRLNLVKHPVTKRYGYAFKDQNINSPIRGLASTALNAFGSAASALVGKKDAENIDWAIPPQYDDAAKKFKENLSMVKVGGKVGFIDIYNRFAIRPTFDDCDEMDGFHQGLAAVKVNGKWGYIDKRGKLIIEAVYDEADAFEDCLIAAVKKDGLWGAIDITGREVVAFKTKIKAKMITVPLSNKEWRQAKAEAQERKNNGSFSERLNELQNATDMVNQRINSGYIDDLDYHEEGEGTSMYILDQYQRVIVPDGFDRIVHDELSGAFIVEREALHGAFLYNGSRLINPCFDTMTEFVDGRSTVTACGITGWIDLEGHLSPTLLSDICEAGMNLENEKNQSDARKYYDRTLLINPEYAPAYNNLALLDIANKDYRFGMRKLKLAHELAPDDETISANLEWAKESRSERRSERWHNGFSIATAILGLATTAYSAYSAISGNGGTSYSGGGNYSGASAGSSGTSASGGMASAGGDRCKFCTGSGRCSGNHRCRGTGKCNYCNGQGFDYTAGIAHECGSCKGNGKCTFCGGTGQCKHCGGTGKK